MKEEILKLVNNWFEKNSPKSAEYLRHRAALDIEELLEDYAEKGAPKQEAFERFNKWIDENASHVRKIKNQITFEEYCRLTEKYNGEQIKAILLEMANYKDAPKKYVSVNLTFQNWARRRYE